MYCIHIQVQNLQAAYNFNTRRRSQVNLPGQILYLLCHARRELLTTFLFIVRRYVADNSFVTFSNPHQPLAFRRVSLSHRSARPSAVRCVQLTSSVFLLPSPARSSPAGAGARAGALKWPVLAGWTRQGPARLACRRRRHGPAAVLCRHRAAGRRTDTIPVRLDRQTNRQTSTGAADPSAAANRPPQTASRPGRTEKESPRRTDCERPSRTQN